MKDIDNKLDIILRQKLLMGYNPSMNLNENISIVKDSVNKKEKLEEIVLPAAAAALGTKALATGFVTVAGPVLAVAGGHVID